MKKRQEAVLKCKYNHNFKRPIVKKSLFDFLSFKTRVKSDPSFKTQIYFSNTQCSQQLLLRHRKNLVSTGITNSALQVLGT